MADSTISAFAEGMGFKLTEITVKPLGGSSSRGGLSGEPVKRKVYLEDARETVRSANGTEETSETSVWDDPDKAGLYQPGSEVVLPDRTARVIKVGKLEIGDADVDHCRVWLT